MKISLRRTPGSNLGVLTLVIGLSISVACDRYPNAGANYRETQSKLLMLDTTYGAYILDKDKRDFRTYAFSKISPLPKRYQDESDPMHIFHSYYMDSDIITTHLKTKTKDGAIVSFCAKKGDKVMIIKYNTNDVSEMDRDDLIPVAQKE